MDTSQTFGTPAGETTADGTRDGHRAAPAPDQAATFTAPPADVHERTYSWTDPTPSAGLLGSMPGLAMLKAIGDGTLPRPPIMDTLGMDSVDAEQGRVVFALTPAPWHYNPLGTVHGGVLATLLDTATGCAVHSALPAGVGYTSMDLSTRFLRPVTLASGLLRCEGRVLSQGRRAAVAEARIEDAQGRLVAHATSTCLLLPLAESPAG
jgi:uncharacterized protein (TIGR00369 family)